MSWMVFRNGTGLPEYPPDHLRFIELRAGEDALEAVQRYMAGDPTLNHYLGVVADKPANRRFRNCWRRVAGRIAVDLPLARGQVLKEIREARNRRLDDSDKDWARLSEDATVAGKRESMKSYRQSLRDLPAAVQVELESLDATQLESYLPAWPAKPNV